MIVTPLSSVARLVRQCSVRYSRTVAAEMLEQTTDPRRTGPAWRWMGESVELRTRQLPHAARREVERAAALVEHLRTDFPEEGIGLGDHLATQTIAETFARHGERERIRYLMQTIGQSGLRASDGVCRAYVTAALCGGVAKDAVEALRELLALGYRPSMESWAHFVRVLSRRGDCTEARQVLSLAPEWDGALAGAVVSLMVAEGNVPGALDAFRQLGSAAYDEEACVDLVRAMEPIEALRLLEEVLEGGAQPTVRPFVKLATRGPPHYTESVLNVAVRGSVNLDERAYALLVCAACERGDVRLGEVILEEMLVAAPRPEQPDAFLCLIRSNLETGRLDRAQDLLAEMVRSDVEPTEDSCRLAAEVASRGAVGRTRPRKDPRYTSACRPTPVTHYSLMSSALRKLQQTEAGAFDGAIRELSVLGAADELRSALKADQGEVRKVKGGNVVELIQLYAARGRHEEALAALKEYLRETEWEAAHFASAIELCASSPVADTIVSLAEQMGLTASDAIAQAHFRSLCARGHQQAARAMFEQLHSPVEHDWVALMSLFEPRGRTSILDTMQKRGVRATCRSYNSVLESLVEQCLYTKIQPLIDHMRRSRVRPDDQTFELWTSAASAAADPRMAMRAFRVMKVNRLRPPEAALKNIFSAHLNSGDVDSARRIAREVARSCPSLRDELTSMLVTKAPRVGDCRAALEEATGYTVPSAREAWARRLVSKPGG